MAKSQRLPNLIANEVFASKKYLLYNRQFISGSIFAYMQKYDVTILLR